jgi:arylsulfatase A-like enzyme
VIASFASATDNPTVDGRNGRIGKQAVKDTGPLTKKRMKTIDEEVTTKKLDFMERAKKTDKPFFLWYGTTRMHIWTDLKAASDGKTGLGIAADAMTEHDGIAGQVLNKLKELGLEENTIVVYTSDNDAEVFSWPDGGMTPFRNGKNSN